MNTLGIERRWPRRERARIDPRWVVALGAMLALFVGSFVLGDATKSASAPHTEASSSLSVTPAVASIPVHLSTAPALGVGAPVVARPVYHKKSQPAAQPVSSPLSAAAPHQETPVSQPVQSAPAPAPRPAPAPVAAPPAAKPAPVHTSTPSSGRSKPSSSGGGSFESSG